MARPFSPLYARFLRHVPDLSIEECWPWQGVIGERGYGQLFFQGRLIYAHRASFFIFTGHTLPSETKVLHECDNPPCVNPHHLFSGTQKDNLTDMAAKGRHWLQCASQDVREASAAHMRALRGW